MKLLDQSFNDKKFLLLVSSFMWTSEYPKSGRNAQFPMLASSTFSINRLAILLRTYGESFQFKLFSEYRFDPKYALTFRKF